MANVRELVLNILMEYERDGVRKPSLLKDSLNKYDYLETRDKAFMKRVVDGCIERQIQIDHILNSFSKTPTDKMQPFIRNLLRMSVYQILFMDSIPDSAACNEAVKLAGKHKFQGLKGFVNGVLRNIARNRDKIAYPDRSVDGGAKYLSTLYSMPEWICNMWLDIYGFEKTEGMLKFFLEPRPTTVRLSLPAIKKLYGKDGDSDDKLMADYIERLENAGVVVKKSSILPYALDLEKTDNIRFLPGFEEGAFFVQDVSSMLVTEMAEIEPSDVVVDVCAAPGGKSLHAAERAATVLSRDVSERKCELIRENAERMGLSNLKVELHDAKIHDRNMENKADVIYLDLPCSGLGIIGRKNDIKYNASKKGLSELSNLQWEIIKTVWDYVKPGGTLMYSTCTVDRAENEEMVKRICTELPFETVDFSGRLPKALKEGAFGQELDKSAKNGYIQLIPGAFGTDGFFIARLKRV
ncbi:MAG: 16S rRNA (cytosine(967)-C(5))-methyltransferase RsmB [Butyrivibrio sp.]|nr:16S rRNA (cytosine(967)-C(5))-methyltransferase RsmB [Butyrivibrio sp.]